MCAGIGCVDAVVQGGCLVMHVVYACQHAAGLQAHGALCEMRVQEAVRSGDVMSVLGSVLTLRRCRSCPNAQRFRPGC
jgi:hypothetical protein